MTILSSAGTAEYVEESTFDNFPSNPAMLWIGRIDNCILRVVPTKEPVYSLKAASYTGSRLTPDDTAVTGQEIFIDMTYLPQNWTFIQYALHNGTIDTSAPVTMTAMTDLLKSVSMGFKSTDSTPKYAKIGGLKVSKIAAEFMPKTVGKITVNMRGAQDNATAYDIWSTSDYIGSGSHASASTIVPLSFKNVKSVTWGGSAISNAKLGGIKFEIDRALEDVYDTDETNSTKIGDFQPTDNILRATITVKKGAIDPLTADVLSVTERNLVITITGNEGSPVDQVFTFSNMVLDEEFVEFKGKGLASQDYNFINGTDLALS